MTFDELKLQTSMLLTSENKLTNDVAMLKASLKFAYIEIADMSTPLKWLTLNKDIDIMRQGPGSYFVRMPSMPVDGTDELDIDSELVPAVARMIASYVAKDVKIKQYHRSLAQELMKKYDAKVREYMQRQEQSGAYDDYVDDSYILGNDGSIHYVK